MLARYLAGFLLELAWAAAASNSSSSSFPVSTSTLEVTSFVTQTAPAATGGGTSYANGTGMEYASSCNQAKLEWMENRGQTYVSNSTFTTSTSSIRYGVGIPFPVRHDGITKLMCSPSYTVIRSGWIETHGDTALYTLCDGYPRMNASTEYTTIETTPTQVIWSTFATQTEVYRNASAPTCSFGARECSALRREYSTSLQAYSDYMSVSGAPSVDWPTEPVCGSPTIPPKLSTTLAPAACMFNHATIQLL